MIRGTTPTIIYLLPFDVDVIDKIWLTFSQNQNEVLTLENDDLTISGTSISAYLTQAQTLEFDTHSSVAMQLRILTKEGNAIASNIMYTDVGAILRDGEIK